MLGSKAGLRFNPLTRVTAGPDRQPVDERLLDVPDDQGTHFGDITMRFVRSVLRGEQPDTSGEEALEVTRLVDAAYLSASIGKSRKAVVLIARRHCPLHSLLNADSKAMSDGAKSSRRANP